MLTRRIVLAALVMLPSAGLARADNKVETPDFSHYPQNAYFQNIVGMQTDDSVLNGHRSNLLAISAFVGDGSNAFAVQYSVTENGLECDFRNSTLGMEDDQSKQLSAANLADLHSAIKALPSENEFPPMGRLVIVSFRDGATWVTRSYDDKDRPQALRKIYDIIGERFESKQRQ